jgi:hypothetical protein
MRKLGLWSVFYKGLAIIQYIFALAIAIFSASLKADTAALADTGWKFLTPVLNYMQHTAWFTIFLLTIGLGLAQVARSQIGPPWVWEHLHMLLDSFQELVFGDEAGDLHHHRATLFKRVHFGRGWRFGDWRGWLVPVERSGHATRKSKSTFRAPDNADKAQGVAGSAWAGKQTIYVEGLPDVSGNASAEAVEQYANATRVPSKWLVKHKPCSRSFCGIPFDVKGKRWGVIVLDSRNEQITHKTALIDNFFKINGRYLSKLMERG